jgi:hypothetical protein
MSRTYRPESIAPMKSEVMMYDLLSMPQILGKLVQQPLEWQPLAKALLAADPKKKPPTAKLLHQELEIPPSRLRRWLEALYFAYSTLLETDADAVTYPQVEHQLILNGSRASQVFSCRLPVTPRVGEQIYLNFLRAVTGEHTFYVDSITHDFSNGHYFIMVYLKYGYFNEYRHQLIDRARFDETMSIHVDLDAPEYFKDDLLRTHYPPPAPTQQAYEVREQAETRYNRQSGYWGHRRG